jgi:Dolichyl-phosphate-mannose-protein mannosyltransferase
MTPPAVTSLPGRQPHLSGTTGTGWATASPPADLAIHAVLFVVLAWWSWRKWPDPLIDFGRELYVPWQITQGKVLYRDVASLFGPLSSYMNALWFRLFGVSLLTLAICNMSIFAATIFGIHRLVRLSTDRLTANVASFIAILLFGFNQYLEVGNYNFISPYSHESTHGLALSVGLLTSLHLAIAGRGRVFWAIAGLCFGCTFLTKPEIFLAAASAVVIGTGVVVIGRRNRGDFVLELPLFLASAGLPPLAFFSYFVAHMSAYEALKATCGAWAMLFGTGIPGNIFYLRSMGLANPIASLTGMLLASAGLLMFAAATIAVSGRASGKMTLLREIGRLTLIAVAIGLALQRGFGKALPLTTMIVLCAAGVLFWRGRTDREESRRFLPLLMWSTFAFVLLAKKGLNPSIDHYGFYLALPATTVAIILMCWLIPHFVTRLWSAGTARGFREIALCAIVAATVPYLALSQYWYRGKQLAIGAGADRFYAVTAPLSWHGAAVRETYEALEPMAASGVTLAVLPEGVMLNYLLRLDSPLRVINLKPPELMAFGEEDVLRSLSAQPPDFVVLVHQDTDEYGYPLFGTDPRYGQRTRNWVDARYQLVRTVGRDPRIVSGYGMEILRRKSTSTAR